MLVQHDVVEVRVENSFVRFYDMTRALPRKHCASGYVLSFSFVYIFLLYLSIPFYTFLYLSISRVSLYLYAIHTRMNQPSGLEVMHEVHNRACDLSRDELITGFS